jgi:hypothetical protein
MYKTFYDIESFLICAFVYKIFLTKNIPSFEQQAKKLSHLSLIRFYSRRLIRLNGACRAFWVEPEDLFSSGIIFWAQEVAIFFFE